MCSMSITGFLFFAFLLYLAVKLIRRRKKGKPAKHVKTEVDRWIDDALARELQRKLGLDKEVLLRALDGAPEPDAVGAMEEAVRSMQVKYSRTPDGSYEVRLDVSFEDNTSATATRVLAADKLPQAIKDEFSRTGGAYLFRAVYFPWSAPNT